MRQGQNSKRSRGRGGSGHSSGGGRRNAPSRSQTLDSNGPSIRIRGNASQVYEKYLVLARDANTAGDRIAAENYLQHADHYFRIFNADSGGDSQSRGRDNGGQRNDSSAQGPVEDVVKVDAADAPQPQVDPDPQSQPQPDLLATNGMDQADADKPAAASADDETPAPRRRGRPPGRPRTPRAKKANGADHDDGTTAEAKGANPPPAVED